MIDSSTDQACLPSASVVLHRATLRVALMTLLIVATCSCVLGLFVARFYLQNQLDLLARSVAYAVEAPVVFNDRDAVRESLEAAVVHRSIAAAYVIDRDGDEIIRWRAAEKGGLGSAMVALLLIRDAIEPIHHNGRDVGIVKLESSGLDLVFFLQFALGGGLLSVLLCLPIASRLSRNMAERFVDPLQHLLRLTNGDRLERDLRQGMALLPSIELRRLGENFSALLTKLNGQAALAMDRPDVSRAARPSEARLAGVCERDHFLRILASALVDLTNGRDKPALLIVDVDHLKSINDELGPEGGDWVLSTIARRISASLRETDCLAHLGGDEFAVLCSPVSEPGAAAKIAAALLDCMLETIHLPSGERLNASVCIGIALAPAGQDVSSWVKEAYEAMYQAKRAGPANYFVALSGPLAD